MFVWFASGNAHKKQELAAVLAAEAPGIDVKIPPDAGIPFDPDETGSTFMENALIKARELYRLTSGRSAAPVIADDSGLCVDALGGRPGIYSARYGADQGRKLDAAERNALLLEELGDNPNRAARFVCAMVLLYSQDRFFLVQETLEGEVVGSMDDARGQGGFGFDPVLCIPSLGRTVAELSAEEKNRISHRGKAGKLIAELIRSNFVRTEHRSRT
ncbi:MAG: RdgB/HAM1 family non-canonical purine NTP pyrophosphatase [Treponema sp.]|nr:RdgB/HAM1 family non-canonical purine NTP pyrophosphatase [Treponema sp.]